MNDTPTPETDAACDMLYASGVAVIPLADFARKLERERDQYKLMYEIETTNHIQTIKALSKTVTERDEARAEAKDYRDADAETHGVEPTPLPWE